MSGGLVSHFSRRPSLRRLGIFAALAIFAAVLVQAPQGPTSKAAAQNRPLELRDEYRADFSDSQAKGIGFNFSHTTSGLGVDLRLKGYPGSDPTSLGSKKLFQAGPGVKVVYESSRGKVKEEIILDQPSPSEFSFHLDAGPLDPTIDGDGNLLLTPHRQPSWMFRIQKPVASDRDGTPIPVSMELNGRNLTVRLDPDALSKAKTPIVIDPTIEGGSGPQARTLFRLDDGRLIYFHRHDTPSSREFVYCRMTREQHGAIPLPSHRPPPPPTKSRWPALPETSFMRSMATGLPRTPR